MSKDDLSGLIAQTALGDRKAFSALYAETAAKLFGVTLRILKDRAQAEDAVQEVYVRIWRRAGSFRVGQASAMAWPSSDCSPRSSRSSASLLKWPLATTTR